MEGGPERARGAAKRATRQLFREVHGKGAARAERALVLLQVQGSPAGEKRKYIGIYIGIRILWWGINNMACIGELVLTCCGGFHCNWDLMGYA